MQKTYVKTLITLALLAPAISLAAGDGKQCRHIDFGSEEWPATITKSELAQWMLDQLGYEASVTTGSVPIIYESIASGDLDIFFGQWMPAQRNTFRKYGADGSIDIVTANLEDGKYTLGVPTYVYEAGITSMQDLAENKDKFDGKIYGIEAGSGANDNIQAMIEDDYADLGDWEMVDSSVSAMLSELDRRIQDKDWIVFTAWQPHPMNLKFDISYLAGGDEYWGPNYGEVTVNTVSASGLAWECPNVGQFLQNYTWTNALQSTLMDYILNDDMEPLDAGKKLVRENPDLLHQWLQSSGFYQTGGITTRDGKRDAYEIISEALTSDEDRG